MKHGFLLIAVLLLFSASLFGQSVPASGGELRYRLLSPFYLGGGAHITKTETPQGTYLNPASAAGFQRTILDFNYINLQGLGGKSGMGHAANIAVAIPTRRGVFTTSLGFLDTRAYADTAMDLGISGHINAAFSKEIYSDIWFGIGAVGDFGQLDGTLQGGGALNLGFLHFPDAVWGLKNFSWGGSITGLGYRFGSLSRGYLDSIPSNITPAVGLAFDIVHDKKLRWTVRSDLRVPAVSDLWIGLASDLHLGKLARLSVSTSLTLRDAFSGSLNTLIPSVSLGFNFSLGGAGSASRLQTTELDVQAVAAPLYGEVWGFGGGIMLPFGIKDTNAPVISLDYRDTQYISPNYDGVQDELIVPYTVEDERYITAFKWRIVDSQGNTVRAYVNKEERPENETVQNLWTRLVSPKEGTPLPEVLRWDGVTDAGSIAPDGKYEVHLQFSDDNGNTASAGPFPVVVDTVPPELDLRVPEGLDLIFSPDGDGFKDIFAVRQEGSQEHLWESEFQDASETPVKTWTWEASPPQDLDWNGLNETGDAIIDGVYRYAIHSTDRAGNSTSAAIEGIIIDTQRPEIGLAIDKAVFSPETSSKISTITLTPDIPVSTGIIDWNLEIVAMGGSVGRSWARGSVSPIPQPIVFDGRDNNRRRLAEGEYFARLSLEYSNGFRPKTVSPNFVIDVTPPQAEVKANWSLFSPQGGSRRDRVTFEQKSSAEKKWNGTIIDSTGAVVNEWTWIKQAASSLVWDGRNAVGRLVPDGQYQYFLSSVDGAGNYGESSRVSITVDTSTVEASITASLDVFGPTGNGRKDSVTFYLSVQEGSPVADWLLRVLDAGGNEVMRWAGEGALPDQREWNGRGSRGSRVDDGLYTADLAVNYLKGDTASARTGKLTVDTKSPLIDVVIEDKLFSPDGDGEKDTLSIRQTSSSEESFEARLFDANAKEIRSWIWPGSLKPTEWDGTDESGNALPDGQYRYVVSGMDKAGNETRREVTGIRIDTAPTPVYLTAKEGYIKAGETDPEKAQSFTTVIPNDSGIASWVFQIEEDGRQPVFSRTGVGKVPDGFQWNGTDSGGKPVEGVFKGVLNVVYEKGSRPRAESRPFVSDGSPPKIAVNLEPQPFSPDDDNVDDEVIIGFSVEDRSRVSEWSFDIFDPRERDFIMFSGRGRPSERIIWDGRSGRGELVESAEDYPFIFTVTDILGHTASKRGIISVDVLVIREGDRLKIRINNMTFQPSSPRLTLTGEEGQKNIQVLDRLAEIMKKYGRYKIIVEGHAVSLKWANPAAAKQEQKAILLPLSQKRAQTVVNELAARGIPSSRLAAVGVGGEKPIVPHGDEEERWRNRRVEFYLEK